MPLQMKITPIDARLTIKNDLSKPAAKSRLKRLFERQFPKLSGAGDLKEREKDDGGELEPSSLCLDKLVVNFIEDGNEKPTKCCGCFNGNIEDSSDDEFAGDASAIASVGPADALEVLKGLMPCESLAERNLLADASKIVESNKSKIGKGKDNCIMIVTENLKSLGYDASICKSKWEKTPSIPAGEYDYIDVLIEGDRLILDVDFRSEFEIARSTKNYRAVLQSLPLIFVGKSDRLQRIVTLVSEAARLSLKKKGLHFPPWRKLDYMKSKWLASYERTAEDVKSSGAIGAPTAISAVNFNGEFEMRGVVPESEKITVVVSPWTPPAVRPKSVTPGAKVVTGLSSVLTEKSPSPPAKF
ncbi:uncharacterized protein A4U43_C03F5700 [Asparagus officinalis]|uniref:DUF506 family protein n=1 Tax=Asparagus officinalis TaxID=4686 RepID=A0A5P1FAE4_ASPOF|nr:uncharacterized protein LOC109833027 [Asparagus officinalis]ONK74387.1 uncharacterized protein A4U43_C03F5700 [Asparagus officinalis]